MGFSATVYDTQAIVTIRGSTLNDFNDYLEEFKDLIAKEDRVYDPDKKAWIVKNYEKYKHLPWMFVAIENRRNQLSLF